MTISRVVSCQVMLACLCAGWESRAGNSMRPATAGKQAMRMCPGAFSCVTNLLQPTCMPG
jgi:hypothetical protein